MSPKKLIFIEKQFFLYSILFTLIFLLIDIFALKTLQSFLLKIINNNWSTITQSTIILLLGVYVLKTVYSYIFYKKINIFLFGLVKKYSSKQINNFLNLPGRKFYASSKEEKIKNVYQEVNQVITQYLSNIISITVEIIIITGLLIYAAMSSVSVIIFLIFLILFFAIFSRVVSNRKLLQIGRERFRLETVRLGMISRLFDGFDVLKAYGSHEHLLSKYEDVAGRVANALAALKINQSVIRIVLELTVVTSLIVLVLCARADLVILKTEDFALLVGLFMRLIPSATKIKQAVNAMTYHSDTTLQFLKNLENVHADRTIQIDDYQESVLGKLNPTSSQNFQYVLRGASGSGKSTIIDIIIGNISTNQAFKTLELSDYFYGTQFITTFGEEFWLNVDLNNTGEVSAYERVDQLLSQLGMTAIKSKNPEKFSGGELKILSLCRLVFIDPAVIFLDEPTTGLDVELERKVIDYLDGYLRSKKFIVILHGVTNKLSESYTVIEL